MMTNKEIQLALIARGFDVGRAGADGDIGPDSIKAIEAYQHSAGLNVDGVPGELTQAALQLVQYKTFPKKAPIDIPPWLTLAYAELGVKEGPGAANNARVVKLFADSGFPGIKQDSVAWCAAAVGAMLKRSGFEPSYSLMARSYEKWGVGIKNPVLGCIATKKRGTGYQGHVGFVVAASADTIVLLGGNQGDAWSISSFPRKDFTSFRLPTSYPIPSDPNLPTTIAGAKSRVSEA